MRNDQGTPTANRSAIESSAAVVSDLQDRLPTKEYVFEPYAQCITELADRDVLRDDIRSFDDLRFGVMSLHAIPGVPRDSVGVRADLDREVEQRLFSIREKITRLVSVTREISDLGWGDTDALRDRLMLDNAILALVAVCRLENQEFLGLPFELSVFEHRHHAVGKNGAEFWRMTEHLEDVQDHLERALRTVVERLRRIVGVCPLNIGNAHRQSPLHVRAAQPRSDIRHMHHLVQNPLLL